MYRKVFVAENISDLNVKLPIEYLHRGVEVIAFEVDNLETLRRTKKKASTEAVQFFKTIQIDISSFRFNRDEANER